MSGDFVKTAGGVAVTVAGFVTGQPWMVNIGMKLTGWGVEGMLSDKQEGIKMNAAGQMEPNVVVYGTQKIGCRLEGRRLA